jgi:hypothetical protein
MRRAALCRGNPSRSASRLSSVSGNSVNPTSTGPAGGRPTRFLNFDCFGFDTVAALIGARPYVVNKLIRPGSPVTDARLCFSDMKGPRPTPGLFHCLLFVRMYGQHSRYLLQATATCGCWPSKHLMAPLSRWPSEVSSHLRRFVLPRDHVFDQCSQIFVLHRNFTHSPPGFRIAHGFGSVSASWALSRRGHSSSALAEPESLASGFLPGRGERAPAHRP